MKKKLLLFFKSILFLALLVFSFAVVAVLVERKSSYDKNQIYMEEAAKDHVDAFILGSSHVINGINPLQLYDEHGITAYNLGGYGSVPLSSYWQFRLALSYHIPKVVIVDAYMLENDVRYIDDPNANVDSDELHLNIDRFPLSRTKIAAINDMFENPEKKYPFLFDYIIYHDRWKELDKNDFKRLHGTMDVNHLFGAVMEYGVHPSEFTYTDFGTGELPSETVGTTYLRRIIEDCQARNIDVVVVTVPFLAMEINQQAAHTAEKIAEEYNVLSLNMLDVPGIIDFNEDLADAGHLNALGSKKVTGYLGDYLDGMLDLPDHRGDIEYARWQEFSDEYENSLTDMSEGNEGLYSQLLTLALVGDKKDFCISVRGGSMSYADKVLYRSLKTLGAADQLDSAVLNSSSYFLISDHGNIYEYAGDMEDAVSISTSECDISYRGVSDIYRILNIGEDTENNLLYSDDMAFADIQIMFFEDGQLTSHQYYTSDHFDYEYAER